MSYLKLLAYKIMGRSPLIDINKKLIKNQLVLESANKRLKNENRELKELLDACQDDGR